MKHLKTYENENKEEPTFNWEFFKNYVETYDPSTHGGDDWYIILSDMLYGLGVSIDKDEFQNAGGFKKFKEYLKTGINWKVKKDTDKYNL